MKRALAAGVLVIGVLAAGIAAFLAWAYAPVPEFEPLAYEPVALDVWPTETWPRSTPEEQGMRSERLVEMMAFYEREAAADPELYVDSMTVVRNGHVVAEYFGNPLYPPGEMHVIHSATKSIVSILVGIAIDKGYLASADVRLVDIFADRDIQNLDVRKEALTVRDLLTMQTGLHSRDSYLYGHDGLFQLQHSEDWVQYALDLPMAAEPGTRFDYSNISTFLLAAIVREVTDKDTLEFARENLFGPLGITDVKWEWNSEGWAIAWARMWLKPNDMAKIGLLMLQQGNWDCRQIVSSAWVRDSITPWAYPQNVVDVLNADMSRNQEKSIENWVAQRFIRPLTNGYGYQWWLDATGNYTALGTNGQYIIVSPAHNLIFVVTAKSSGIAQFAGATLFYDRVLKAIVSDTPLPADKAGEEALAAYKDPPELSQTRNAPTELPDIARSISGTTYVLERNPFNTRNLRFVFPDGADHAEISYQARETWDLAYQIGLDGVYQLTETNNSTVAAKGEWVSPDRFTLEAEIVGYSTVDRWEFAFEGNNIRVTEVSISGTYTYGGRKADRPLR